MFFCRHGPSRGSAPAICIAQRVSKGFLKFASRHRQLGIDLSNLIFLFNFTLPLPLTAASSQLVAREYFERDHKFRKTFCPTPKANGPYRMPVPRKPPATCANMYCSISGAIPSDPVVSIRSGHLYDRPLIEKVLAANGNKCPETGESLTKEDLLSVKTAGAVAPMPPEKSSVPDVLQYIKEEWERLTVEVHHVKRDLHRTRQELATSLYRYDAAVKVIANLERERDEARQKQHHARIDGDQNADLAEQKTLENENETILEDASASVKDSRNISELPPGLVELAKKSGEELQTARKARKPVGVPSAEVIGTFSETGRVAVDGKDAAVTSLVLRGDRAYAGCTSGKLHIIEDLKVTRSIDAHSGGVTSAWIGNWEDRVLSGGRDGCVRVWDAGLVERGVFEAKSAVVGVERHEIGIIFCCYEDGFVWRDQDTGAAVASGRVDEEITCGAIHPDGMVFATGGNGVGMWDLASMTQVAHLGDRRIIDVAMSEKGYYMVSCDGEGAHVWDLRKQQIVGTMELSGAAGVKVDMYGEYGCVAGNEGIGLFVAKKRASRIAVIDVEADSWKGRRGVAWGEKYAVVGSGNGTVRWYNG